MPLQIKRGTNTQRLAYTPAEGELVFVTNYVSAAVDPLWIGDGTTVGGRTVSSAGSGLTEVANDTTPELGGNLNLGGFEITGIGDIDITGTISATGAITSPVFVGDMLGSLFADDSSLIIDANNRVLSVNDIKPFGTINIENQTTGVETIVEINATNQNNILKFIRNSDNDLSSSTSEFGILTFSRNDPINNEVRTNFIAGGNYAIYLGAERFGNILELNTLTWTSDGRLGVGKYLPTAELDVVGNAVISGTLTAGAMLLSGSNIDTSDSSAITVTPAVTFSSDVIVENNLIVSNTLTVDTLEVTNFQTAGSGTPELASDTDILLTAGTRVEITQSPLKMASFTTTERNALTPQNGDVIYNTTDSKFQGYAGGTWVDLH